jgi:hypothetical protein
VYGNILLIFARLQSRSFKILRDRVSLARISVARHSVSLVPKPQLDSRATETHASAEETVELRDWRISDNRTVGAIRPTDRLPVLSPASSPRDRGSKFRSSSWLPEETPGRISSVRTRAIKRKRKINGINVPCSRPR